MTLTFTESEVKDLHDLRQGAKRAVFLCNLLYQSSKDQPGYALTGDDTGYLMDLWQDIVNDLNPGACVLGRALKANDGQVLTGAGGAR